MPAAAAGQQTYVMQVGTAGLTLVRGGTDTQAGESNGTVTSGPFSFTMPGEYIYEVKELGNGVTGYTYDNKVYTLKYKVQQVGTILTVTKEVSENGGSFTAFTGALDFTNDYQRPQYTVTYDADGGNVTPSTETVKHGNKVTEPQTQTGHTSPAGEKTGYHFGGWIDTATNTPYNFNTPVTGNKNLKAKWDINQYRVIVKEPHDADPGMQDHEYLNNPNVNHGDTVTAPPPLGARPAPRRRWPQRLALQRGRRRLRDRQGCPSPRHRPCAASRRTGAAFRRGARRAGGRYPRPALAHRRRPDRCGRGRGCCVEPARLRLG